MATSGRDLIDQIAQLTNVPYPDAVLADQAITALAHTGRGLMRLAEDHDDRQQPGIIRRQLVVRELGTVGSVAASRWAPTPGRLPDLAGAAADILTRAAPSIDVDSRWAAAVTLSAVARRCVGAATRFLPYARTPELLRVARVAGMVERLAALDPPRAWCSALDVPIPVSGVSPDVPAGRLVVESAAGLAAALARDMRANVLHVYGVLAAAAAAESVAGYAATIAAASQPSSARKPREQAPTAWRVLQAALIRFDDGSRYSSAPRSAVTQWAMHLTDGTERLTNTLGSAAPVNLEDLTAATRFAAGQLPSIATQVERAMYRWVGDGKLFARARALPQSARHVRAVVRDDVVIATPDDLRDVVAAARTAGRVSAALAKEIERTATIRSQPRLVLDVPLPIEQPPRRLPEQAATPSLSTSREDMAQHARPQIAH